MLAISSQRDSNGDERKADVGNCWASTEEFCKKFMGGELLEDINFDDLFAGLDDEDMLPDLAVDPAEILAAFSVPHEEESGAAAAAVEVSGGDRQENALSVDEKGLSQGEEVLSASKKADDLVATTQSNSSFSEADRDRKTSAKGSHSKRKVKVDWTPELHRRFVGAVEQLGIDKAVPSRILELMGIDCLTRHNVASHLQSKESIDAALGDVLAKPWLPLPIGLKPPSLEGALVESQRQGISKIPSSCST